MSNHYYTPTATSIESSLESTARAETLNHILPTLAHDEILASYPTVENVITKFFATTVQEFPELFIFRNWLLLRVEASTCIPVPVALGWGELESTVFIMQEPISGEQHQVVVEDLSPVDISDQAQAVATILGLPQ